MQCLEQEKPFSIQEHARCFSSNHAVGDLWKELLIEDKTDLFHTVIEAKNPYQKKSFYLIHQDDNGLPQFLDLEPIDLEVIQAIQGDNFMQICNLIEENKIDCNLGELLQKLANSMILCDFYI